MDISDATTSVESTGVSPEFESKTSSQTQQIALLDNHNEDHDIKTGPSSPVNLTQDVICNDDDHNVSNLDNRFKLPLESKSPHIVQLQRIQRNAIARTLANSHPLMSPPGTDSDSEQSREQRAIVGVDANGHKCQSDGPHYNFPDVVPANEHLQVSNKSIGTTAPHNKMSMLRNHSLDLLSSESEADVSQYHAAVEVNLQSVALISRTTNNETDSKGVRTARQRKNGCDDISSLDSISNHSFDDDEDLEHNLASLSPTSSLADGLDDYDNEDDEDDNNDDEEEDDDHHGGNDECEDDAMDLFGECRTNKENPNDGLHAVSLENREQNATTERSTAITPSSPILPQYSADEERRNSRNWQKITLPDGRLFEIDMRVIEPYKRVLSHGGYLKAGGHNAIVIFCACHLPDRSRADYSYVMDNLFLYVVKTLEQLVTDDYVLIYLHGGCNRRNVPPFPWLKKCYQLLDRRLRKSLKNMYLVHPTFWVKSIVWMARPFVSVKFWRKLVYVKSLEELSTHVAVEKAAIPEKVKQYDSKHT